MKRTARGRRIRILTRRLMASKDWQKALKRWSRDGVIPVREARIVAEVALADADAWRYFRQLRNHLEKYGLTREEALERIARIARTEEARRDGSATDAETERMAKAHGRAAVANALDISREEVKKRISNALAARRKGSG